MTISYSGLLFLGHPVYIINNFLLAPHLFPDIARSRFSSYFSTIYS